MGRLATFSGSKSADARDNLRYEILGIKKDDRGGLTSFREVSAEKLKTLIELHFIDPEKTHNNSPKLKT